MIFRIMYSAVFEQFINNLIDKFIIVQNIHFVLFILLLITTIEIKYLMMMLLFNNS
jgi:hypothetical protein